MNQNKKIPEEIMRDFQNGAIYIQHEEKLPDFHTMALLAAQTIPSKSIQELLSNAEKIEYWLNEPARKRAEFEKKLSEVFK